MSMRTIWSAWGLAIAERGDRVAGRWGLGALTSVGRRVHEVHERGRRPAGLFRADALLGGGGPGTCCRVRSEEGAVAPCRRGGDSLLATHSGAREHHEP